MVVQVAQSVRQNAYIVRPVQVPADFYIPEVTIVRAAPHHITMVIVKAVAPIAEDTLVIDIVRIQSMAILQLRNVRILTPPVVQVVDQHQVPLLVLAVLRRFATQPFR